MKERSVTFYKRLIKTTALSIMVIIMGLLSYFVANALNVWNYSDEGQPTKVTRQATVNSDGDLAKGQKAITPEALTNGQTIAGKEDKTIDNQQDIAAIAPVSDKMVYLTFDDGPSKNTAEILKILEGEQVKATFFFNTNVKKQSDSIIKKAFDDGHAVGVLTSTGNDYREIYASVNNYLEDFEAADERIYEITGERPTIFRFPGGSINSYNKAIYKDLVEEMTARGYVYFDWNVCALDYSGTASQSDIVKNATKRPHKAEECIVLMHDIGYENAGSSLKEIIQYYKNNGYYFQELSEDVEPITF